jgi:hypothetical protein
MSGARLRGLLRLAVLVGIVTWLVVLATRGLFSGGSGPASGADPQVSPPHHVALKASRTPLRLPEPLHGATAAPAARGLLVIGGADQNDVSSNRVLQLDPSRRTMTSAGTLATPMHDAAAATIGGRTFVFGGGAATTFDTVQELTLGHTASEIGRLPDPASDLSAVSLADGVYVAGGYDGRAPVDSILHADTTGRVSRVARLVTPVRYAAIAAVGGRIYLFGGELGSGADTDVIQEYDPATRRAIVVGHLAEPVAHASALVFRGTAFLLGGRRGGVASDQILRFDPSRGAGVRAGRLPWAVFDAAAGVANRVGYLVGGIGAGGASMASVIAVRG